jgi:hypothetical protein
MVTSGSGATDDYRNMITTQGAGLVDYNPAHCPTLCPDTAFVNPKLAGGGVLPAQTKLPPIVLAAMVLPPKVLLFEILTLPFTVFGNNSTSVELRDITTFPSTTL